jgi:hypothetical protein
MSMEKPMEPKNRGKLSKRSKFNTPTETSPFLRNFQNLLLVKMIMIKEGTYSKEAMDSAIVQLTGQKARDINMDIDPIQTTCDLEPAFYFRVQETAKKLTGDVMPMDELMRLLLTYFVVCYEGKTVLKKFQPFIRANPSQRLHKLNRFKILFGKYFKNHVSSFPEQVDSGGNFL